MSDNRIGLMLVCTILAATLLPLGAAFYFANRALQTSLNLGFNTQIVQVLESSAANLKILKTLDPDHRDRYREEFESVENLHRIYAQPQWVKGTILGSLEIYFGAGLAAAVLLSVPIALLLGRRIRRSYRDTFRELLAQRERVTYLEQMSSWQELAKVLAHEIKNPLTPIEVLVTSLSKAYQSKTPEEFHAQLGRTQLIVAEELAHLKQTVSRFSEFARLPQAELVEADPAAVIERQIPVIAAAFATAQVQFDARECASGARTRMDPSLFRHVLTNIVRNGVEANPNRSVLFRIRVSSTDTSICLVLMNDGEPVRPDLVGRMFEPYVSDKSSKDNMGLGLAIVKKIIIEHRGEIGYAEEAGHPRFTILLPRVHIP
jgi:signal transduction histidine kinase